MHIDLYINKIICIICFVLVRVLFNSTTTSIKWRWLSLVPHKLIKFKYISDPYRIFKKLSLNVQTQYPRFMCNFIRQYMSWFILKRLCPLESKQFEKTQITFWQASLTCIISCLFHQIGFDKHPLHILYCIFALWFHSI